MRHNHQAVAPPAAVEVMPSYDYLDYNRRGGRPMEIESRAIPFSLPGCSPERHARSENTRRSSKMVAVGARKIRINLSRFAGRAYVLRSPLGECPVLLLVMVSLTLTFTSCHKAEVGEKTGVELGPEVGPRDERA
jgi:hypothetical protein